MDWTVYLELGIATGLGLLVGLQREWMQKEAAGIRTMTLITVLGTLVGTIGSVAPAFGPWLAVAGMIAVAALMLVENVGRLRRGESHTGPTTEVAALIMFAVGVLLALHQIGPAVCIGGGVAVLLQWKKPMHDFVGRIGEDDMRDIIRLALIALVVLPMLPNESYGPYDVLNPFNIWLMVALIIGISIAGYVAFKLLGTRVGTVLGGVLGGVISSTATTVSYSRRTRGAPETAAIVTLVIMLASTVVFLRIAFEVLLVAPSIAGALLPPLAATALPMVAICLVLYLRRSELEMEISVEKDPSALKAAFLFGALYALVLLALAAVKEHFGQTGTYVVAALSGLTDVDAITLSTARLVQTGRIEVGDGWRMIQLAALSNLAFKGLLVALLGHRSLLRRILLVFGISLAGGGGVLLFWP